MTVSKFNFRRLLLALSMVCLPFCAEADSVISLPVGAQRIVSLDAPVTRIVVTEPGIVEATVLSDRQVQIVAVHAGHTNLTLFTSASNQGDAYSVQVGGTERTSSGGGGGGAPAGPNAALALRGQPDLRDVQIGGGVMTGNVGSLDAHNRAADVAKAAGAAADLTRVAGEQMVAVEIHFAAVSVNTMKALGFNFQSLGHGIQGALVSPSSVSGFSMSPANNPAGLGLSTSLPIASAFSLFLSSPQSNALGMVSVMQSAGLMQLLAEPTLLARSGEHASFLAGGDIPIPVPQNGAAGSTSVTIDYHPYGVKLDIAPVVLSPHRILLRVSPEVSEIDPANGVTFQGFTVPAFRRRSTSTTIELDDGQSYMLAGLIYNNDSYTESKVPGLGDIPIIGSFFKFTQNSRQRQELIVVATPHLVRPMDTGAMPQLPGAASAHYDPSFGDILLNAKPLDQVVHDYGLAR
jgi:pilus assembly protein CpaC